MTDTLIEVPLTRSQIEALLVGTDADQLEDARRQLRAARAYATLRQLRPSPNRRTGRGDRRGSIQVQQMLATSTGPGPDSRAD